MAGGRGEPELSEYRGAILFTVFIATGDSGSPDAAFGAGEEESGASSSAGVRMDER